MSHPAGSVVESGPEWVSVAAPLPRKKGGPAGTGTALRSLPPGKRKDLTMTVPTVGGSIDPGDDFARHRWFVVGLLLIVGAITTTSVAIVWPAYGQACEIASAWLVAAVLWYLNR